MNHEDIESGVPALKLFAYNTADMPFNMLKRLDLAQNYTN
jgi:hypothetical protein